MQGRNFNRYMESSFRASQPGDLGKLRFQPHETLIDVGGGLGGMISAFWRKTAILTGSYSIPLSGGSSKAFLADRVSQIAAMRWAVTFSNMPTEEM